MSLAPRTFPMAAGLLLLAACHPHPTVALAVDRVEDLGPLFMPPTVLGRDGGASALIAGRLLWTFGDTFLTAKTEDGTSLRSSTAAWAGLATPRAVEEPLDVHGLPGEFLPFTAQEAADNARDVQNGWALWPGPTLLEQAGQALFLYQRIKRSNGSGFESQGIGIARVPAGKTAAVRDPALLFVPPEPLFGSGGGFADDQSVYLYACQIVGFLDVGCKVARAPRAGVADKAAYQYFDGGQWVPALAQAKVVLEHAAAGITVRWNPHLGQYLAVHSELLGNRVQLRAAPRPEGPWTDAVTVETSPAGLLPASSAGATNYLAQEHFALSSADGRELVVGYSRPLAPFRGEVRLARIFLK